MSTSSQMKRDHERLITLYNRIDDEARNADMAKEAVMLAGRYLEKANNQRRMLATLQEGKKEEEEMGLIRMKPEAVIETQYEGKIPFFGIGYYCPICHRQFFGYRSESTCKRCGTFLDWGNQEAKLCIKRYIKWE